MASPGAYNERPTAVMSSLVECNEWPAAMMAILARSRLGMHDRSVTNCALVVALAAVVPIHGPHAPQAWTSPSTCAVREPRDREEQEEEGQVSSVIEK